MNNLEITRDTRERRRSTMNEWWERHTFSHQKAKKTPFQGMQDKDEDPLWMNDEKDVHSATKRQKNAIQESFVQKII